MLCLVTQLCLILWDSVYCSSPGSSVHGDSPGENTGVGCHVLLQGIFPTQGLNPGLLHCRQILYRLSHQGSPRILEWVAYPFSRGSSWPGNQTGVSCIAGRFFTSWATRETQILHYVSIKHKGVKICHGWKAWQPAPVFLPGEFHGQRSLVGNSPWSRKESDTTEQLTLSLSKDKDSLKRKISQW